MKLKDSVLQEIKKNDRCRRALMDVHDKKESTVLRWLRENSPELTLFSSLQVIAAFLRKEIDEMIVYEEHDFRVTT